MFVNNIANELGKSSNFFESMNESNSLFKDEIFNNKVINLSKSNFGLKYDLINKNFDILKGKFVENYNNNFHQIEKLRKNLKQQEMLNTELDEEKNKLLKENNSIYQVTNDQKEKFSKLITEHEKMKELYSYQKDNQVSLKKDCEELNTKYEMIYNEYHNFMNNTFNKLNSKFSKDELIISNENMVSKKILIEKNN